MISKIKALSVIMILFAMCHSSYAKLNLSLAEESLFNEENFRNKLDHALLAANGKEWYVENVMFKRHANINIFFAPCNALAMTSRYPVDRDFLDGLKRAIDYLADTNENAVFINPRAFSETSIPSKDLNYLHELNYWALFISVEWRTMVQYGKLDQSNAENLVAAFYSTITTKYPFGAPQSIDNYINKYLRSCKKKGVRPFANDYDNKRSDFTTADIEHFLECRFKTMDYYTDKSKTLENPISTFTYQSTKSNNKECKYFKTHNFNTSLKFKSIKDVVAADSIERLTFATCPQNIDKKYLIKSISKFNNALYEANGRDWYVKNVVFSSPQPCDLYFPFDGCFIFSSRNEVDSTYIMGITRAINYLATKRDTLYAPIEGWRQPYRNKDHTVRTICRWIEKMNRHYLFDDGWRTRIQSGSFSFTHSCPGSVNIEAFGFSNIILRTILDNGTIEGRKFRQDYEKSCRERNLNVIGNNCSELSEMYDDKDIDLFLEWMKKADEFYLSLRDPPISHIMDHVYTFSHRVQLIRVITKEVSKK